MKEKEPGTCSLKHNIRVFYKLDEIGNNANIGIHGLTTWKQKIPVSKMLAPNEYWTQASD